MRRLNTGEAREQFAEIVNDAAFGSKRTIIMRRGKEIAAVVPVEDLKVPELGIPLPEGASFIQVLQSGVPITVTVNKPVHAPVSFTFGGRITPDE